MIRIRFIFCAALAFILSLSGCAELNIALGGGDVQAPVAASPDAQGTPGAGRTAEALDRTTAQERTAAAQTGASGPSLGRTVASLGNPAEPGFWLKTPLVSEPGEGRIRDAATGSSVAVVLIPIDGPATAGSRISLSAMRLLGVRLSDLVTVDVSR